MNKDLMKNKLGIFIAVIGISVSYAQQVPIPRIEQMPNIPSGYKMLDWKQKARDYDDFVFDITRSGKYLPLTAISKSPGINYPEVEDIVMSVYVGQSVSSTSVAEAINIIPSIVGASLVGTNKREHYSIDWVSKVKDFFNVKDGYGLYLNRYTGPWNDWWYDVMPSVFFYQLYDLYTAVDADFEAQFIAVADRHLDILYKLGGSINPWNPPYMNYSSYDFVNDKPVTGTIPSQPETAGSFAWILYQAYLKTGNIEYKNGAELALDFLQQWTTNPAYELQLPYGIITAARLNAEHGANFDLDKFLNWTFSDAQGNVRGWGTIVGNWNGYEMSGLIGEAAGNGNDYAFVMNGFQHVAALAPVAKYDKRYARSLAKWILNIANASRYFYVNELPAENQDPVSRSWSVEYDPQSVIPYEAIKQRWNGTSPYARGDALDGGWAPTNLSLYSGAAVGYLAAVVEETNVEGILQIDLNKTDFGGENMYPNYLYYNPYTSKETVLLSLPLGCHNVYDAITDEVLYESVSGEVTLDVPAGGVRLIVIYPAGSTTRVEHDKLLVDGGGVISYHYQYDYVPHLRIKAFSSDKTLVAPLEPVELICIIENGTDSPDYSWYVDGTLLPDEKGSTLNWIPDGEGIFRVKCKVSVDSDQVISEEITIRVQENALVEPKIYYIDFEGEEPFGKSDKIRVEIKTNTQNVDVAWICTNGKITQQEGLTAVWELPEKEGLYTLTAKIKNAAGESSLSRQIRVRDLGADGMITSSPILYYPFNGNTKNAARDRDDAILVNALLTDDSRGNSESAYEMKASHQYIYTPNSVALNFTNQLTLSFWIKPATLNRSYEQYIISHGDYLQRYKVSITPNNQIRFTLNTTKGIVDIDDLEPLVEDVFYHYTCVYTGFTIELYRNGKLAAYKIMTGKINTSDQDFVIGRRSRLGNDSSFAGTIDEVRLYDKALSVYEISQLPFWWDLAGGIIKNRYSAESALQVYPNPVSKTEDLTIEIKAGSEYTKPVRIEWYDLSGNLLIVREAVGPLVTVDRPLLSGVYLLKVKTDNFIQGQRIIVQ